MATTPVSHQTVRLARGRHRSAEEGVCVMELASMLADEAFTDRPACVCPVLGEYLRTVNDRCNTDARQALYPLAAEAVGTRADREVEAARRRLARDHTRALRERPRSRLRRILRFTDLTAPQGSAAARAAAACLDSGGIEEAVAFARRLIGLGDGGAAAPAEPRTEAPAVVAGAGC